ncbi:MAG: glycosyltransferase family 2 protein [Alphaproteobacteria bacterium]|nr:glycosyltransferase family 2 protein [Alphaproteobacteria bacterium]
MLVRFLAYCVDWAAGTRLAVRVHLDGLRADPAAYCSAARWWLLGKRLRARGQLAPLLSQSPGAYGIWLRRAARQPALPSPGDPARPIIALVDGNGPQDALGQTLASLVADAVLPIVLPAQAGPRLAALARLDWAASPWLLPMQAGDRLAPGAAAAYRAAMAQTTASVIYADDDLIDGLGRRHSPHFKPDWNRELFRHHDYLSGAAIIRAGPDALMAVAGQDDWAARLVAGAVAEGGAHHVRGVLHHRVARPPVPALPPPLVIAAELPPVSVIVPTRNRLELLRTCLAGVAAAAYPDIELIVVDNGSDDPATLAFLAAQDPARVRVLRQPGPFNYSALNNRAVAMARGRLLCLLNNDVEMRSPDWLAIMATQALRPDVGAVGAQLLYPDGRIQHAGVVIGVGNAAGHAHRLVPPQAPGYFRRHALPQFTMAVTAACLVVARERFLAVGGLDEANFPIAFNDVDLCLRLNRRGWQSLYEPRAVLIHHESVSRGDDRDPVGAARLAGEIAALQRLWHTDRVVDPFHHPQLSRASEQFVVAL